MDYLEQCDIVWDSSGANSSGSVPIGNGEIALILEIDRDGDLLICMSKSEAFDENGRPASLGQIRISLDPNPFRTGTPFRQKLQLKHAEMQIAAGPLKERIELRLWVDANAPVVRLQLESQKPVSVRASVALPDSVLTPENNRILWCRRNTASIWLSTMHLQSMDDWAAGDIDPLLYRTSGAAMEGSGLAPSDSTTLRSTSPATRFSISIHPLTIRAIEISDWSRALARQIEQTNKTPHAQAKTEHDARWEAFWDRSFIHVSGDATAQAVTRAYARQRFAHACTSPPTDPDGIFRFDSARWRYWPMLAAGDFAMMRPLFQLYLDALPMALHRTRTYFSHPGAFFPPAMHVWGSYLNADYGIGREGLAIGEAQNPTLRRHWSGGLELLAMLLEHELYTFTEEFSQSTLLPLADAIITFYDRHYPRVEGKIRFAPAQSLDVWLDAIDPLPEIAGLKWVLEALLKLPHELASTQRRSQWQRVLNELPPLPARRGSEALGANYLIPAAQYDDLQTCGNPELAAVFPYRIFGVGKPEPATARRTFKRRQFNGKSNLDLVQATLLGIIDEGQTPLVQRFDSHAMLALQYMLLQCDGSRILILPAWPRNWDANWKLHAPMRTTVEGIVENGELRKLTITPEIREKDAMLAQ
jgi:alpha-L-fucosidase 2